MTAAAATASPAASAAATDPEQGDLSWATVTHTARSAALVTPTPVAAGREWVPGGMPPGTALVTPTRGPRNASTPLLHCLPVLPLHARAVHPLPGQLADLINPCQSERR